MQIDTFWSRVDRARECWLWVGTVTSDGYGKYGGHLAHRLSYELTRGAIPDGHQVDHLCANTRCVKPDHLEAVTAEENIRRATAAITHCKRGHEFTPENTYIWSGDTRRYCIQCRDDRRRGVAVPASGKGLRLSDGRRR